MKFFFIILICLSLSLQNKSDLQKLIEENQQKMRQIMQSDQNRFGFLRQDDQQKDHSYQYQGQPAWQSAQQVYARDSDNYHQPQYSYPQEPSITPYGEQLNQNSGFDHQQQPQYSDPINNQDSFDYISQSQNMIAYENSIHEQPNQYESDPEKFDQTMENNQLQQQQEGEQAYLENQKQAPSQFSTDQQAYDYSQESQDEKNEDKRLQQIDQQENYILDQQIQQENSQQDDGYVNEFLKEDISKNYEKIPSAPQFLEKSLSQIADTITSAAYEKLEETDKLNMQSKLQIDSQAIDDLKEGDLPVDMPKGDLLDAIKAWNALLPKQQLEKIEEMKVPVYVPVPLYSFYQVPVLHHYPVNQVERQIQAIPFRVNVESRETHPLDYHITVEKKNLFPEAVPYPQKIPVPVPVPVHGSPELDMHLQHLKPKLIDQLQDKFNKVVANSKDAVVPSKLPPKKMQDKLQKMFKKLNG